jgi:hypothetical protein
VAVVFVVGLVFVVLDADEVGVFGGRVEGEGDDGVDGGGFGDDAEGPGLASRVSRGCCGGGGRIGAGVMRKENAPERS